MTDWRSQYTPQALLEREMRGIGAEAQRRMDNARRGVGEAVGRALTQGELNEIQWMFNTTMGFSRARVFPRKSPRRFPTGAR